MTEALKDKNGLTPIDPRFSSVDCIFFVIGAQKAGTTWLSRYFREHPNISVPYWKEHNYWNMVEGRPHPGRMLLAQKERREKENVLRKMAARFKFTMHAKRQRAITLALEAAEAPFPPYSAYADVILENAGPNTLAAGELCPQYAFLNAKTFAEMARLSDNVRFIYLMRDPVERFISSAQHSMRKGAQNTKITSDSLSIFLRKQCDSFSKGSLSHSQYDKTITRLETSVPLERIEYVFFEELFDQSRIDRICAFLGVPSVSAPVERKRNVAGSSAVNVSPEDRALIAKTLKPVYNFIQSRFGTQLPKKWQKSAELLSKPGTSNV